VAGREREAPKSERTRPPRRSRGRGDKERGQAGTCSLARGSQLKLNTALGRIVPFSPPPLPFPSPPFSPPSFLLIPRTKPRAGEERARREEEELHREGAGSPGKGEGRGAACEG
jgi:hypothetical protein